MSKVVVAMVGDYPLNKNQLNGGVQAATYNLANSLNLIDDVDLKIITFSRMVKSEKIVTLDDIPIHILPRYRFGGITRFHQELSSLKKCLSKLCPDIVHGQGIGLEGFLAIKSGYPNVVTIHGIIGEDAKYITHFGDKLRSRIRSIVAENYCIKHATNTILISPYVKQYYGHRLTGNFHYIANPISPNYYSIKRKEQSNRVLFAGKIIPLKGIQDLILAADLVAKDSNIDVLLSGSLEDKKYVDQLNDTINKHKLNHRIHFLGLLNENEMLEEFSKAVALVLPSHQENAPMAIQQAMAAKVPVIATTVGGIPDQLDHGQSGLLFKPGDHIELARHLKNTLHCKLSREKLSRRAYDKAQKEYQPKMVALKTTNLYKAIISSSKKVITMSEIENPII